MKLEPVDEKEFASEWGKVKREYPLVAMRYLEALQFIVEEQHKAQIATSVIAPALGICHPKSPTYLGKKFCDFLEGTGGVPRPDIQPGCRRPTNKEDLEDYLSCLESRIGSFG